MPAPPFTVDATLQLLTERIARTLGRLEGMRAAVPQPRLRKANRIRTVQGSVAIEGNTLTLEQVTALLDGRRIVGDRREVLEVKNTNSAYERAASFNPFLKRDLLRAHGVLMDGLVPDAGRLRAGNVGIYHGHRVAHVAPPASRVGGLVEALLRWLRRDVRTSMLIKASVVHYELQFIHPFSDGNGRIGRLWQHVCLLKVSPVFQFVPVESVIKERQAQYYRALAASDAAGDCAPFLEFSLRALHDALEELAAEVRPTRATAAERLAAAREHYGAGWFTRRDYLSLHRPLSPATASRDLREGVDARMLVRRGDKALSEYRFRAWKK